MNDFDETRDPIEQLAEEFLQRHRRGERPSISEYAETYPDWSKRIRELFPTLLILEEAKLDASASAHHGEEAESEFDEPLEQLGDFRILREIGRGGMGIVYEAEQESLGRRVALKVLPASYSSSPKALRRFRREAQAAARLHHTNIVSVFGVGREEGKHFYVMQYIEGPSLDRVLAGLSRNRPEKASTPNTANEPTEDFQGGDAADAMSRDGFEPGSLHSGDSSEASSTPPEILPRKDPSDWRRTVPGSEALLRAVQSPEPLDAIGSAYWRSFASIGAQVADALHYAHKQGTLHRDVKPGNLMLDNKGTVWITDFGLAKMTDQDDLTHPGDAVGTLRYMAPEQLEGTTDARTDIYSLGLTLYELLTLRPAFNETSRHRLLRQVGRETPPRPRAINPAIPHDLETIILKAISREPDHRYQTAEELADDLQRFLEDRPIRARRASALEHAWRWCRRNPAMAILSTTALILLLMVAVGMSAGYYHRTTALKVEKQLREQAESERRRAEANLALAAEAFEDVFSKVSGTPLLRTFEETDEGSWPRGTGSAVVAKKDALVLQGLLRFYDRFAEQNHGSTKWRHETGMAYRRVGEIQQRLGRFQEARDAFNRALEAYERLARRFPDQARYRVEMAAVHNQRGDMEAASDRWTQALDEYRLARQILVRMSETTKLSPEGRFQLAKANQLLGLTTLIRRHFLALPEPSDAKSIDIQSRLEEARELLSGLVEETPFNGDYRLALAECHGTLWLTGCLAGDNEEATRARNAAIRILKELLVESPDNPEYRHALARIHAITTHSPWTETSENAAELLQQAATLLEEVTAAHPDVPEYQWTLFRICQNLGEVHFEQDRLDAAEEALGKSIALVTKLESRFPEVRRHRFALARSLYTQAVLQNRKGQLQAARKSLQQVLLDLLARDNALAPESPPHVKLLAKTYTGLADVQSRLGELAEAEKARSRALATWETYRGLESRKTIWRKHLVPLDPWTKEPPAAP